jgi:hypothetical protein
MNDAVDPRRVAAEALHDAILDARRVAGDGAICDAFDLLGASAGHGRYRRAAAAIRGLPPGRAAIDDDLALQQILKFPPNRRRDAVGVVAREMAREMADAEASRKQVHAIEVRLRRKLKEKHTTIL